MPEDQLTVLPPEVRQMVMTGATTMMSGGGPNAMMGAAVGMNPMMDMTGMANMNPMAIGPMGMGMSGDMGMQMMQEVPHSGAGGPGGSTSTPEQGAQMAMPDGFNGGGQMGMGMGNEFGMQVCVLCVRPGILCTLFSFSR
jgi:pre-mRNA 3'-end-processing factor FIP1